MVCPGCYGSQLEGKSNEKMNPSDAKKKTALRTTHVHVLVGCRLSQTFAWLDASCHPGASWGATSSEGPSLTTHSTYHTPGHHSLPVKSTFIFFFALIMNVFFFFKICFYFVFCLFDYCHQNVITTKSGAVLPPWILGGCYRFWHRVGAQQTFAK